MDDHGHNPLKRIEFNSRWLRKLVLSQSVHCGTDWAHSGRTDRFSFSLDGNQ